MTLDLLGGPFDGTVVEWAADKKRLRVPFAFQVEEGFEAWGADYVFDGHSLVLKYVGMARLDEQGRPLSRSTRNFIVGEE